MSKNFQEVIINSINRVKSAMEKELFEDFPTKTEL